MNVRESLNASFNRLFQVGDRISLRKIDHRLYVRKKVLASMLCFSRQCGDQIAGSFLLCNIPRDFRRPDDFAFRIFDGRNC